MLLMAEHLGLCNEDMLFRMLETIGRVRSEEDFKKSETFTGTMKRWLRQRRNPKDIFVAVPHTSPTTEQITSELGLLWEKLESQLSDPFDGLSLLTKQAKRNFSAIKSAQSLQGHLLPYIPHDRAGDYDVNVNPVNGWLDTLSDPQIQSTGA
jgi:hypothetical protein